MFAAVYASNLHHPGAAWAAAPFVVAAVLLRRPPLWALALLLELEICVDALFTGGLSPLAASAPASTYLAVLFVILGDWRFFYLVLRQGRPRQRAVLLASAWSLVVPVASFACKPFLPADPRFVFLVYEALFLALTFVFRRSAASPWQRRLCDFEAVQYATWALADVLILAGLDAGFALRLLPNVMYYVAFVPFAVFTAPREARA